MTKRKQATANQKMRTIYEKSGKTYKEFADALCISWHTVESWFRPESNKSHRKVTAQALKLAQKLSQSDNF